MTSAVLAAATAGAGDVLAVVAACLAAGTVNALAGGGSLLSYPTMVAVGLGPVSANVSNTLALWPGYASGAATLRKRLAAIGLPVSGDPQYGVRRELGLERQCLHAYRLRFVHPFAGAEVDLTSPLPADLEAALERARRGL